MPNRVMVFIDGANLYNGIRQGLKVDKNAKVDVLAHKLVANRELIRIYYYNSPIPPSNEPIKQRENQAFWDKLGWIDNLVPRKGRILPKEYTRECPHCHKSIQFKTHVQKGVDTRIVVDMVTLAVSDAFDVAILISGDSDLAEAVDYIREHTRKKVENAYVPCKAWSKGLRESADIRIPLTKDFMQDCLLD